MPESPIRTWLVSSAVEGGYTNRCTGPASPTIVIIGAGGIGGWLGTRLVDAGARVAFLVHGRTLEALNTSGIRLVRDDGVDGAMSGAPGRGPRRTVLAEITEPIAHEDPGELLRELGGHPDLVIVTTKVDAVVGLLPAIRTLTGPATGVVTVQNGIGAPGIIADAVGAEHVMPGVARVYTRIEQRGTILLMAPTESFMTGEWDDSASPRTTALVEALNVAGVHAEVPDSIQTELWRKAAFVVPQGGLGAAVDAAMGELRTNLRDAYAAAVGEVVAVAEALGHRMATPRTPDLVAAVLAMADRQPPGATTSMQRDLAAGVPSELDAQVGAIARAGDQAGVPTPIFDVIAAVLAPLEAVARGRCGLDGAWTPNP